MLQSNPSLLWNEQKTKYGSSINVFPCRATLTSMLLDVLAKLDLKSVCIFYYEDVDVLLWKGFVDVSARRRHNQINFIRIDERAAEYQLM